MKFLDLFCWQYRFLLHNLVVRNIKLKYKGTWLGLSWTLIAPASAALVYHFIFSYVMKLAVDDYLLLIIAGVLPWNFFLTCIGNGLESLVANHRLLNKIPIPIQTLPFSEVITGLSTLLISVPVLVGVALFSERGLSVSWFLLIPAYFFLFIQGYAFALILSVSYVYFRDIKHLVAIVSQVWFYLTPIIYPVAMVPESIRWVVQVNPLGSLFACIQQIVWMGQTPDTVLIGQSVFWTAAMLGLAYWVVRSRFVNLVEAL